LFKEKKQIETLFLDEYTKIYDSVNRVNIILSPSLYWVKKITLPLKSEREIRPLLPSIFEDILLDEEYNYIVYKEDNIFFAFAYNNKKILKILEAKKIPLNSIDGVYFTQSEFSSISTPIEINKTQILYIKDDIVIVLPNLWVDEKDTLDLNGIILSKHKVVLSKYNNNSNNYLYKIILLLFITSILMCVEYLFYVQKVDKYIEKKDNLFSKYKLEKTMFQNRALLNDYKEIDTKQIDIRKQLVKLLKNKDIVSITIQHNKVKVKYGGLK